MGMIPMDFDSGFESRFAEVTGTAATTGNQVAFSYPTGFTYSNCILIGLQYLDGSSWRTLGALNASVPCALTAVLNSDKIYVNTRDGAASGASLKLALYRYA